MPNNSDTQNNDLQLLAIPQLMGKHFFIPNYQRGYRWGRQQVYQLLEDLWRYFHDDENKGNFYCLQPIVVKECTPEVLEEYSCLLDDISALPPYREGQEQEGPKDNVWYEVIDGQQRLTTIRLLMAYYNEWEVTDEQFTIKYATRPELSDIFDKIIIDRRQISVTIDDSYSYANVDVEYITEAAKMIYEWFLDDNIIEIHKKNEMGTLLRNFFMDKTKERSVQVIWYETKEATDARDIFERLNNLKVPLSSSELIRAIFMSKQASYRYDFTSEQDALGEDEKKKIQANHNEKKKLDINAKWDEIEHYFHNDKFWAFITNREAKNYRNRIEFLFDIMSEKYISPNESDRIDRLFTYLYFDNKKDDLDALWGSVVSYFDTLRYWFENKDYYHKIGYLICLKGDRALIELLSYAISGKHRKSEFEQELNSRITKSINSKKFSELEYNNKSGYAELKNLLFLYNVEYTRAEKTDSWFPFSEYKREEQNSCGWTLEHIHAQNSECLDQNSRGEWLTWVTYTIEARENIGDTDPAVEKFLVELRKLEASLKDDIEIGRAHV